MSYSLILHLDPNQMISPKGVKDRSLTSNLKPPSIKMSVRRGTLTDETDHTLKLFFCLCASRSFVCLWNFPFHSFILSLIVLFWKWHNKNFLPQEEHLFVLCLWKELEEGKRKKEENLMRVQVSSCEFVCTHSRQTHNIFITGEET